MDFSHEPNRIYATDEESRVCAEVTFPNAGDDIVNINHTFVAPSLRGRGIASLLLDEAYQEIKGQNKKVVVTCSYAEEWFDKHSSCKDIIL